MHIGSGYMLTSAHIVADDDHPGHIGNGVQTQDPTVERIGVEVLWFNEDIALLRSHYAIYDSSYRNTRRRRKGAEEPFCFRFEFIAGYRAGCV